MAKKENTQENNEQKKQETSQQNEIKEEHIIQENEEKIENPPLFPFYELVNKNRIPTWQSAAILKLLEKEDDVHLTEQEFSQALERLYNRKMGA